LDEAVGGVVAAGGFAGVAGEFGKREAAAVGADLRGQFQQRRVDAAELFRPKVPVVNRAGDFAVAGEGEMPDGFEEVGVREGTGR
jgi:hypothetical protein